MTTGSPTPAALRALARRDPVLGAAMRRVTKFPGFPHGAENRASSHFHALARAVIYQMLSGKAAATIHERVRALTPGSSFPKAHELLRLGAEPLRACGLSGGKTVAILDLAERSEDGRLPLKRLGRMDDAEIVEHVTAVRGIGEWTAQMFLMFRLGRLDVMPTNDLGIQEGLKRLDGLAERPKPKEVLARSEPWMPLRSVASWVLWRLCDDSGSVEPS